MFLNDYETVFILPPDYSPQRVDEFIEKIKALVTKNGGETTVIDKWGRRRLAYPIKRHREGFYVFLMFKAPGPLLAELTQFFRVNEDVVRHIVCKAMKGKPGSPTMSVPAPLLQTATTPYFRPPPAPPAAPAAPGSVSAATAGVPVAAPTAPTAPSGTAPSAPPTAEASAPAPVPGNPIPKEESHERPPAPAPAQ